MNVALQTGNVSAEGLAFVRGALPSTAGASPELAKSSEKTKTPPVPETDSRPASRTPRSITADASSRHFALVGLSTRISADLHECLLRASFERKLARHEPWTHQEILSEALATWLKKAGYP